MLKILLAFILIFDLSGQPMGESIAKGPVRQDSSREVDVVVTAQSGAAYDVESQTFLWEKNADELRPMASLTKLITGILLAQEDFSGVDFITMTKEDQRAEGGNRHLYQGEKLAVEDVFYAAFMASDNEAVMALVRSAGYTEKEFVNKMNAWLRENGFSQTVVFDPTGLNPNNVSTAKDMALLAHLAFAQPEMAKFLKPKTHRFTVKNTGRIVVLKNTNKLLDSSFGVKLGKTGYIEEAGYCFVSLSEISGHDIITVVFGSDAKENRFQDTKALLYWLKNNFLW